MFDTAIFSRNSAVEEAAIRRREIYENLYLGYISNKDKRDRLGSILPPKVTTISFIVLKRSTNLYYRLRRNRDKDINRSRAGSIDSNILSSNTSNNKALGDGSRD